jgi:hypothetical protein
MHPTGAFVFPAMLQNGDAGRSKTPMAAIPYAAMPPML